MKTQANQTDTNPIVDTKIENRDTATPGVVRLRRAAAGLLLAGVLAGGSLMLHPARAADDAEPRDALGQRISDKQILGTWVLLSDQTFVTFTPGATVASSFSLPRSAFAPNGRVYHTGHGTWVSNGRSRQIVKTDIGRVHDLDGNPLYWYTTLTTWEYDPATDRLIQVGQGTFKRVDPSGRVIASGIDRGGGILVRFWGGPDFQMP